MSGDLIASFPAAGSGGSTLEQLELLAGRRGLAYVELANPASVEQLASGEWRAACVEAVRGAGQVLLVGHCMGGLSAVRLADGLAPAIGAAVRVLGINAPCPDADGRIPTMSGFTDAQVAEVLAQDDFPPELLEDEDMLAEIADGLRADAVVADRLAEEVAVARPLETLRVLSTRGDTFIPPEHCSGWWRWVTGEFHLTVAAGGHALDDSTAAVLDAVLGAALE